MNIELTTTPSDEDAHTLSMGLIGYNHAAAEDLEPNDAAIQIFLFARDDSGEVRGGLRATCFWNTLHLEAVWLSAELRGEGIGTRLVNRAEEFAIEHGCELALAETASFQAAPFYERLGYERIATIADYPRGHAMHYMTKRLGP